MKKRTLSRLIITTLLTTTLLTGCGSSNDAPENKSAGNFATPKSEVSAASSETEASGEGTSTPDDEIDAETMEFIKYNIYVEVNNYIIKLLNNINSYYTVVADADEFSLIPDSGYSYGYDISGLNSSIVDDAITVSQMEPAFEELDTLVAELAAPMRTLMDTFSDINNCRDYANNQYEQPKNFHPIIHSNTAIFIEPAYQFLDALDTVANERVAAEEEKMLADGELIAYNSSHVITIVNKILDECYEQGIDDYNLTELDLTNIKPLYDELVQTVEDYNTATSDNDQLVKESLSNSTPFDGLFDSMIQALEWMIKQVESQKPLDDPSIESLGSLNHVHVVLSRCIDRYNSIFAE